MTHSSCAVIQADFMKRSDLRHKVDRDLAKLQEKYEKKLMMTGKMDSRVFPAGNLDFDRPGSDSHDVHEEEAPSHLNSRAKKYAAVG